MKYLFLLLGLLACQGCTRPPQKAAAGQNKFADATIRQIYTLQDTRQTAGLLFFLQHEKALYREEAALALASVQDKKAIPALAALLSDPQPQVRQAAAYALGQTFDTGAEAALQQAADRETLPAVLAELLEALGKCASQAGLDYLAGLALADAQAQAGQAWGIYRTYSKKLDYQSATKKVVALIGPHQAPEVQLGAAHFLARTPGLDLAAWGPVLTQHAQAEPRAEVRMALAQALAKVRTAAATNALLHLVQTDVDYRVRINALKALGTTPFELTKDPLYQALHDENVHTALTAAELLLTQAPPTEAASLFAQAQQARNWRLRATLLAAALKTSPEKTPVRRHIESLYRQSPNRYEKGALLAALSQDITAYPFIEAATFSGDPVLGTYGLQALIDLRSNPAFPAAWAPQLAAIFRRAITSGDAALVGMAAGILQKPELSFKAAYPNFAFLKTALRQLQLPRDMEAYQELEKAIYFFEGRPAPASPQNPYTHPINWDLVQRLPSRPQVRLQTSKGLLTLELLLAAAPGTVANFVELVEAGFFQGKNFHRVVPNFVVQGGDPRGDGWGGPDYAIRTELANLRYREGYVGMASAGKDTEGCQWFITHSPTPHLDGRYTIFARVSAGLPLVHQLEIGDQIESMEMVR